jgi:hypothetical protein
MIPGVLRPGWLCVPALVPSSCCRMRCHRWRVIDATSRPGVLSNGQATSSASNPGLPWAAAAGTVAEALVGLAQSARFERSRPGPARVRHGRAGTSVAGRSHAQITGVESDGRRNMTHKVRPPLSSLTHSPRVEARDDRGKHYRALARAIRLAGSQRRTTTVCSFASPLPQPHVSLLRVRVTWSQDSTSRGSAQRTR